MELYRWMLVLVPELLFIFHSSHVEIFINSVVSQTEIFFSLVNLSFFLLCLFFSIIDLVMHFAVISQYF